MNTQQKNNQNNVRVNDAFVFTNNFGNSFQLRIVNLNAVRLEVNYLDNATGQYMPTVAFLSWSMFNKYMRNFSPARVL